MRDFAFAQATPSVLPRHNGSMLVVAALVHIVLFAVLTQVKARPVRVRSAGTLSAGIAAYVPGPAGVMPATVAAPKPPEPKKTTLETDVAKNAPKEDPSEAQAVGSAGVAGTGQVGSGPVRLAGAGGTITLIRRVEPVYPGVMQAARMTGHVVLDAIINPDGTIGEIKVLSSTNAAFAQSAIAAVRQWRYTPLGYQGILTVNVNFMLT